ncbi:hypothetical protein ACFWY5_35055 [Nonomuraea sp. NPDC059007]
MIPAGAGVFTASSETVRLSGIDGLLVLNAEPHPGRATVLLLREAIGF